MLVVMKQDAAPADVEAVSRTIEEMGYRAEVVPGEQRTVVGLLGNDGRVEPDRLSDLRGVLKIIQVTPPYRRASLETHGRPTVFDLGKGVRIGGPDVVVMAGPCAVESEDQIQRIARLVRAAGATVLRGGAFKPRTSPYAFQGLGLEGLGLLAGAAAEHGLALVTEAMDVESLETVADAADIVQIGSRNMQNFTLLRAVGRIGKPVLLKRGMAATLKELLLAAEYILLEGESRVILCERGIRTFTQHSRSTLDLAAIPALRDLTHLPVIVDPSHAAGSRDKVPALARAAIAAGADGLLVEVHTDPARALSDGVQSITPDSFRDLMGQIETISGVIGRGLARLPNAESLAEPVAPAMAGRRT
jgi:3-deoxy-7-phosphoheptulonate synthase